MRIFELATNNIFFGILVTIIAFEIGIVINKKIGLVICNPLLIAIIIVILFLKISGVEYDTYYKGSSILQQLLTPATVAFAVPLFRQVDVLKKHFKAIIISILCGSSACAVTILILAKVFNISEEVFYGLMPKSVTLAIALGISEKFGGISGVTCVGVVFSGIIGASLALWFGKAFKINNKIALGLSVGTASHAIGTARIMQQDELIGAMGSLAIVIARIVTVFIVPLVQIFY